MTILKFRSALPALAFTALMLSACGGGGGDAGTTTVSSSGSGTGAGIESTPPVAPLVLVPGTPTTRRDAWRLLTQGSFGPTPADVSAVATAGAAAWVDSQLAQPASAAYLARWDADNAVILKTNPLGSAGAPPVVSQFYFHALNGTDQLRQRTAYALSQILVVSLRDLTGQKSRAAASYLDMLNRDAFGNYRTLLQDVAQHPAMGQYLSSLHNMKEEPLIGRIPDQNFAREVMQLFSIGLVQLNTDGTRKLGSNGLPIETYTPDDIVGLSKVFTGWSWAGPDTSGPRFTGAPFAQDPNRMSLAMQAYNQFHSVSEKRFLGAVVAPQSVPDAAASLKVALDTLFAHPNVGPFVGRQLIQRLVTSHPSEAYVARVAAVFNDNGAGVRGDLKAVVRAILLDAEARDAALPASSDSYGKLREPVLRLTAWMRAFNARSDSGKVQITGTDDPGLELGQTPLRSPSVFNFYRPGYVAAGSLSGARGLTVPELQITDETSVAGYVNYMTGVVTRGAGLRPVGTTTRPDVQPDYSAELALATQTAPLVDLVVGKLMGDGMPDAFKAEIRAAVDSIVVPVLKANGANQAQVTAAKQNRVLTAVLLALAAPEFVVQK